MSRRRRRHRRPRRTKRMGEQIQMYLSVSVSLSFSLSLLPFSLHLSPYLSCVLLLASHPICSLAAPFAVRHSASSLDLAPSVSIRVAPLVMRQWRPLRRRRPYSRCPICMLLARQFVLQMLALVISKDLHATSSFFKLIDTVRTNPIRSKLIQNAQNEKINS